jgi:hypothetical protein
VKVRQTNKPVSVFDNHHHTPHPTPKNRDPLLEDASLHVTAFMSLKYDMQIHKFIFFTLFPESTG